MPELALVPAPAVPAVVGVLDELEPAVVDPVLDDELLEPMWAFARMNWPPAADDDDDPAVEDAVDPDVPVAPLDPLPDCKQPVTVIDELSRLLLELLVDCAARPAPASATATHVPNHTCCFMRSSSDVLGPSSCNVDTKRECTKGTALEMRGEAHVEPEDAVFRVSDCRFYSAARTFSRMSLKAPQKPGRKLTTNVQPRGC
jgi:hypothetical protein